MNVIVLHGSMRKNGNTGLLSDEFLRGAAGHGHTVEKIELKDKRINDCLGCAACQKNGGICVQQDDMAEIYEIMRAADVIALACPVYFYTWTSLMKRMIDRTFAIEKSLTHKKFYLISAAAAPDEECAQSIVDAFRQYIGCFCGEGNAVGGWVIGCNTRLPGDVTGSPAMMQAYSLGNRI